MARSYYTERLRMRPFEKNEKSAFLSLVLDEDVQKYFDFGHNIDEISDFFDQSTEYNIFGDMFAITLSATDTIVGCIRYCEMPPDEAVIECFIGKSFRNQRYATEAIDGLLDYLKSNSENVTVAVFYVYYDNMVSQQILSKYDPQTQSDGNYIIHYFDI